MADAAVSRLSAALSDRYRLARELGQGGMATVYLAQDLRDRAGAERGGGLAIGGITQTYN